MRYTQSTHATYTRALLPRPCQTTTLSLQRKKEVEKKKPLAHLHYQLVLEEKPCQPVMSLRENQQMKLDTEVATHAG